MSAPSTHGESEVLLSSLNAQRDHVVGILEGLPAAALQRPVLPSGWTPLDLVNHLALDVERFWFRVIMTGEDVDLPEGAEGWQAGVGTPPDAVFDLYRQEINQANQIIAATSLDTPPVQWPDEWSSWRLANLREVLLHVITETACHAGHLDAARELIDGHQWMVLT